MSDSAFLGPGLAEPQICWHSWCALMFTVETFRAYKIIRCGAGSQLVWGFYGRGFLDVVGFRAVRAPVLKFTGVGVGNWISG